MQSMHPGMQPEMSGMQGMPGMQGMHPGMQPEMCGMQEMPGMQGMHPEMQGISEMERMLHGMHGVPGGYQHHDFDPCCPPPCPPPYSEPIMQRHCPMPMPAPSPAPEPTPVPAHEVYVVRSGDSVYKIAQRYGTTMQAIILANDLHNPDRIYPGQILYIPTVSTSEYYG